MWSGGAGGAACELGVWELCGAACWAIATAPLEIIVRANADKTINFIFMYIPQIFKSNY
jgi:hypothetical protein